MAAAVPGVGGISPHWRDLDGQAILFEQPVSGAAISLFDLRTGNYLAMAPVFTDGQGRFHMMLPQTVSPGTLLVVTATKGDLALHTLYQADAGAAGRLCLIDLFSSVTAKVATSALIPLLVSQPGHPTLGAALAQMAGWRSLFTELSPHTVRDQRLAAALTGLRVKPTSETLHQLAKAIVNYSPLRTPLHAFVEAKITAVSTAMTAGGQAVTIPTWRYGDLTIAPHGTEKTVRGIDVLPLITASNRLLRNYVESGSGGGSGSAAPAGVASDDSVDTQTLVVPGATYQGPIGFNP